MADGYIVFKGETEGIADAFYPTQALADAGATEADLTAVQGAHKIDGLQPNKAYWDGTELLLETPEDVAFDALPDDDKIKQRRALAKRKLRELEGVGGLAAWATVERGDDPTRRAGVYSRWVQMMAIASSIDANLLSNTRWGWLLAEMSIPGELWYVLFKIGDLMGTDNFWQFWLQDVAHTEDDAWSFWNTIGTTITPNSREGIVRGSMLMVPAADFDWVAYLRGLQ